MSTARPAVAGLLLLVAGAARADDGGTLPRIKQHEQEFEKKVKTERDRPDKKARAKQVEKHVEDNIRQLGEEIKDVGRGTSTAAKDETQKPKAAPKPKAKAARPKETKPRAPDAGA